MNDGAWIRMLLLTTVVSFAVCLIVGPVIIPLLRRLKFGQQIREDGPQSHLKKAGTPTMGGFIFWCGIIISCAIFFRGSMDFLLIAVLMMVSHGLIGFLDDLIKVKKKRSLGLSAWQKIVTQFGLALMFAIYCFNHPLIGSTLPVPFINTTLDLGWFYIPFTMFVIIAMTNSTNLTDGLDGLCSSVTLIVSVAFAIILYSLNAVIQSNPEYQQNIYNLMIFAGALVGACMGFLRFNAFPAKIIMGDTGSFSLGAAVAAIAILSRMTLLLPIIGGIYMMSSISVILQVGSYKLRKKRIFKMAPLHHHFELSGIHETRITAMYMLATAVLSIVGLLSVG